MHTLVPDSSIWQLKIQPTALTIRTGNSGKSPMHTPMMLPHTPRRIRVSCIGIRI